MGKCLDKDIAPFKPDSFCLTLNLFKSNRILPFICISAMISKKYFLGGEVHAWQEDVCVERDSCRSPDEITSLGI